MKFGSVSNPEQIDFTLPQDHPATQPLLSTLKDPNKTFKAYIGCAKWNRKELKGFYPRGTKDELTYYAQQFNSIELNATFYKLPSVEQIQKWKAKTPAHFKFFPKVTNTITHFRRLKNVAEPIQSYCDHMLHFEDQLGMGFLQLHDNFGPGNFELLEEALHHFSPNFPLSVEVRNKLWFEDTTHFEKLTQLLTALRMSNTIVDTAGRREILHMRLTGPKAFIRFVGANHEIDYKRLDDWVSRIATWKAAGLQELYFFVHQNVEESSPLLASHFIKNLNDALDLSIPIPVK